MASPDPFNSPTVRRPTLARAATTRLLPATGRTHEVLTKAGMLCGLAMALLGAWHRNDLPPADAVSEALLAWPEQTEVSKPPFEVTRGGVTYVVKPLYAYDIKGLVVSRHSSDAFTDIMHKETADHLNVLDLCLVYGEFARSGAFRAFEYSSGNFTCYAQGLGAAGAPDFKHEQLSNNHLLTEDAERVQQLRSVRIGDQIRIKGYLAEYSHQAFGPNQPFRRGTSTTRSDSGNGACETLYVEEFEVLEPASSTARITMWSGVILLAVSLATLLALPYRARD